MYIDKDSRGLFQLMEITLDDLKSLIKMIEGASLEERRVFNHVLRQINYGKQQG